MSGREDLPGIDPNLFPGQAERLRVENWLVQQLPPSLERIRSGPVRPARDRSSFEQELAAFDFIVPRPLEELLRWTLQAMEHGVMHLTHPGYFGLFNPAPVFAAECADRIVSAINPQLASSATSPAAVAIEAHVIGAVARRAGMPDHATGHFTSGGSEANCTALWCALTRLEPGYALSGARAFRGPPVFYTSAECHIAWLKIGHQTGIGREGLRLVETDGRGRMSAAALERAIREDRDRGRVPVMIVSTAGTTGAGAVDPLQECAQIALREGLWHHVDAAWGGGLIASQRMRGRLQGIELADSVTIDAHKWFATTMGCGMFITAVPDILGRVFNVSAGFMPSNLPGVDPYVTTAQWSRRFFGLRLFLALANAGWEGYAAHVERSIALIHRIAGELSARGWRIANEPDLAVLCVQPPPGCAAGARQIVERVVASGKAWIAPTRFEGQDVVRICATHGESGEPEISALVESLEAAAR